MYYMLKWSSKASAIMEFGLSEFHTRKSFRQSYNVSRHNDLLLLLLLLLLFIQIFFTFPIISYHTVPYLLSKCARLIAQNRKSCSLRIKVAHSH